MPTQVTLYRLFVASPSDCQKERKIVRQLVADWNAVYGQTHHLFLEPVLWETHAHPELGDRPQAIITRQILNSCDALIGIFRSRLGSPTGIAPSGTVEEIDLFRAARKPILLYFFRPPRLNLGASFPDEQVEQYRRQLGSLGLIWSYKGILEFTTDVARHLAMTMAQLAGTPQAQATQSPECEVHSPSKVVTPSQTLAQLEDIRDNTYFVWLELVALQEGQSALNCEIRQVTFEKVRGSLDALCSQGLFKYSTQLAYVSSSDEMPVLSISFTDIDDRMRMLVNDVTPLDYYFSPGDS